MIAGSDSAILQLPIENSRGAIAAHSLPAFQMNATDTDTDTDTETETDADADIVHEHTLCVLAINRLAHEFIHFDCPC